MFKWLLAGLAVLWFGLSPAWATPPLTVYGKLPTTEDLVLSPDGKALAYVSVESDKRRLIVQTVDGAPLQTLSLGQMKSRYLRWAGNDHLLVFVSTTLHHRSVDAYEYEMMSTVSLNVKTGKSLELLTNELPRLATYWVIMELRS
jgi:hypothetical protein